VFLSMPMDEMLLHLHRTGQMENTRQSPSDDE
jgi:hypothetical protein